MRKAGLSSRTKKKFKATTNSKYNFPVAPNLLNQDFSAKAADSTWVGDITYIWTDEGWLYLAVVMDLFSQKIVGWATDKRIKKKLTLDAIDMACWRRKPASGLLHHSDRGILYACYDYQNRLGQYGMIPSMSLIWGNSGWDSQA
jgi:transposase InsO family protein